MQLERERDVVLDSELFENVVFLKYEPDVRVAVAVEILRGKILTALTLYYDLARIHSVETAAHVK